MVEKRVIAGRWSSGDEVEVRWSPDGLIVRVRDGYESVEEPDRFQVVTVGVVGDYQLSAE